MVYEYPEKLDYRLLTLTLAISIASLLLVAFSSIRTEGEALSHFQKAGQGCFSLALLSIVYFQYFGVYVMFLLSMDTPYFSFYIVASFCLILMGSLTYKNSFIFYIHRHLANPALRANGIRSPRGRFIFLTLLFIVLNYVVSTIMVRFLSYVIYISILSLFPLVNVIENSIRCIKQCFSL